MSQAHQMGEVMFQVEEAIKGRTVRENNNNFAVGTGMGHVNMFENSCDLRFGKIKQERMSFNSFNGCIPCDYLSLIN